ncbi:MAG: L-serine ammonia-lyase, iron-sulfur-dependent, subunit alpha [Treponema sp.]|nr:L-serine ammonia-lyase, iron-sulfur-dependent, subunit alpha [Treponema sp.]
MKSIRELYKIGPGPSSSHTIGPQRASRLFREEYPAADRFRAVLYGSLSATGKGHLTDYIIKKTLEPKPVEIVFEKSFLPYHPNGMELFAFKGQNTLGKWTVYSVGGGNIEIEGGRAAIEGPEIYPFNDTRGLFEYMHKNKLNLLQTVYSLEDADFKSYLSDILNTMFNCVRDGLSKDGVLPGEMKLERVAKNLYSSVLDNKDLSDRAEVVKILVASYAYAVSEENASGGTVVTAPTCGSCGILPAILFYFLMHQHVDSEKLKDALSVAGIFGNFVKHNATVSGAVGGCQAECGTACAMAAAAAAFLLGLTDEQIEYSAEVAIEHHLGLTCDPVLGQVQIPCIERNAAMALRAYDCALFGKHIGKFRKNRVSFDSVIAVMKEAGDLLNTELKETSIGGLAKSYRKSLLGPENNYG